MQDPTVLAGFDPGAGADDLVVVVMRRDHGGPWQIEHVNAPEPFDVAAAVAQLPPPPPPAWLRPRPGEPTLTEQVQQWIAEAPDVELDYWQREVLLAAFADGVVNPAAPTEPRVWPHLAAARNC